MICEKCGEAGDFYTAYRKETSPPVKAFALARAKELHQQCPGYGDCDCLHRTP